MEETYKEIKIRYEEQSDVWMAQVGGVGKTYDSLKAAKKAIDYALKKEFIRIPCWVQRGRQWNRGGYVKGTITSTNIHGEVWVTFGEKNREKFYRHDHIIGDNPENVLKINRIGELQLVRDRANKEIEELDKKLTPAIVQGGEQ